MSGEEFQTKDLTDGLEHWDIINGVLQLRKPTFGVFGLGPKHMELPFTGSLRAYSNCQECPAFVASNGNLIACWVEFDIRLKKNKLTRITRVSVDTKDWLRDEPLQAYMHLCRGPMPYEKARQMHLMASAEYSRPYKKTK